MNLKSGDIVYFKTCTREPKRKAPVLTFKGAWGFGVLLGFLQPFAPPPTEKQLMPLMGNMGFLSFDDVEEFLGEEQAKLCIKKYEDKYYPKIVQPPPKPTLILPPAPEVKQ
jgi:hypothetical protein